MVNKQRMFIIERIQSENDPQINEEDKEEEDEDDEVTRLKILTSNYKQNLIRIFIGPFFCNPLQSNTWSKKF